MTPYEMMLSESQERMLMVLHPEKEADARAVFEKWELDFATVGVTTDDLRFRVLWQGDGSRQPADQGARRRRPRIRSPVDQTRSRRAARRDDIPQMDVADALLQARRLALPSARAAGSMSSTTP